VVGIAKAGVEDGMELIGGSCIVGPLGQVLAKAGTTGDELIAARIDLDQMTPARKRWDFFGRRHPEHYGLITQPIRKAT
jgi:N-carbamoyl-D-amino-acid hydrolase